jgi:hypothetical protein
MGILHISQGIYVSFDVSLIRQTVECERSAQVTVRISTFSTITEAWRA